jgi:pilus assembly protein CpaB
MSTIAQGMYPAKPNRWLLIGAAVFALIAGIAAFAALANFSDDDEASTAVAGGDEKVLVATESIQPNTRITSGMFEVRSVHEDSLVPGAVTEDSAVIGKVARTEILEGEQITTARLGLNEEGELDETLAPKIPAGKRAVSLSVDEITSVAGLLVPGDRVDVIGIFTEQVQDENEEEGAEDNEIIRVETVLQDIEVLAFAQASLEALPQLNAEGEEVQGDRAAGTLGDRPEDLEANPAARSVTLALSPDQVQMILAVQAKGKIAVSLRPPAEDGVAELQETNLDDFGFLPPIPRPGAPR